MVWSYLNIFVYFLLAVTYTFPPFLACEAALLCEQLRIVSWIWSDWILFCFAAAKLLKWSFKLCMSTTYVIFRSITFILNFFPGNFISAAFLVMLSSPRYWLLTHVPISKYVNQIKISNWKKYQLKVRVQNCLIHISIIF